MTRRRAGPRGWFEAPSRERLTIQLSRAGTNQISNSSRVLSREALRLLLPTLERDWNLVPITRATASYRRAFGSAITKRGNGMKKKPPLPAGSDSGDSCCSM